MKIKLSSLEVIDFKFLEEKYYGDQIQIVDHITPSFKKVFDNLVPSKRKLLNALARYGRPAKICELAKISRIYQQNKTSTYVSRLVKEGYLERLDDGRYYFNSKIPYLEVYLKLRTKSN